MRVGSWGRLQWIMGAQAVCASLGGPGLCPVSKKFLVKPSGLRWKPMDSGFLYVLVLKEDFPFAFFYL